jgi:hypothetical protein
MPIIAGWKPNEKLFRKIDNEKKKEHKIKAWNMEDEFEKYIIS